MSKTVIITGASGNLGGTVCSVLKEKGYGIIGTSHSDSGLKSLSELGVEGHVVDLSDRMDVGRFLDSIEAQGPSAAIMLAGGFAMGGIDQTSDADLEKMFMLNFRTAFVLSRELLNRFAAHEGQFIFIGAKPGLDPEAGHEMAAYSLSKGLVFHLSELINAYGREKNIHSTVLVPGTLDTAPNRESMPDADFSKWTTPTAIAETIAYLLGKYGSEVRESVIKLYND